MGVLDRVKMGAVLTKDSLLVMGHNPRLFLFPLVSGVAGLAFLTVFVGVTFGLMAIAPEGGALVGLFLIYLVLTFVATFFTAGLVHQTRTVLEGGEVDLRAGLAAAWEVKGPLFVWALVSATVGIVINAIENSDSRLARLFGTLFGVAWTLLTFFVVPVIVFERASTTGMFERSAGTFKRTWGEAPISLVGIQLVSLVVVLPFVLVGGLLFSAGVAVAGIAIVLVGILLSYLVGQTLQGVVKTTLYLYAEEGLRPAEFDDVDFDRLAGDEPARTADPRRATTGGFR